MDDSLLMGSFHAFGNLTADFQGFLYRQCDDLLLELLSCLFR